MNSETKQPYLYGAIGVALLCASMILWPLLGNPPYAYYALMKFCVAAGCAYLIAILWRLSPLFAPLMLMAGGVAAVEVFGKMRRAQWVPINWAQIAALVVIALALTIYAIVKRK